VLLDVDLDILLKRLTGRRTCSKTGKPKIFISHRRASWMLALKLAAN